ncbi:MAG: hypothetical protein ABIV94_08575, partial [Acidimicrobiales bacterium]
MSERELTKLSPRAVVGPQPSSDPPARVLDAASNERGTGAEAEAEAEKGRSVQRRDAPSSQETGPIWAV